MPEAPAHDAPPTRSGTARADAARDWQPDPTATDALIGLAASGVGDAPGPAANTLSFDRADLSEAALGERTRGAAWWHTRLGGVRLAGSALCGASLRDANLTGADLTGADLSSVTAGGIVLARARLEEAKLCGADLIGSDLSGVDAGEADFSEALLEDARLTGARLRFADFSRAVMDGADLSGADLWGARLPEIEAERASFRNARLDEARLGDSDLTATDFEGASLRRAQLGGARLRRANLRGAALDGAMLAGADLTDAVLPHVSLARCDLRHVRLAGAWLERTRMRADQLGGAIGEEMAGDFTAAIESYIVLEQNFRSLGSAADASWAFRRRRRMGKRSHRRQAQEALAARAPRPALAAGLRWLGDVASEWLCDYGESVPRVLRAFLAVLLGFAVLYWLAGCLEARVAGPVHRDFAAVDYLLFSLDSMTTVGTGEVGLKPDGQLGVLLSSVETVMGTVLLGLFGFVLGARMRS